ncbi:MAG: lactate racemase domain-containing protein [Planctomycetota bacterium]
MSEKRRLRYGTSSTLRLDLPAEALVADCTEVPGTVVSDPAEAVAGALSNPVSFPPLGEAVVPGDRVVIAIDPDVPRSGEIVAGVVGALLDTVVEPDHITVLQTRRHLPTDQITAELPTSARQVNFAVHDPDDQGQLAYLAASKDATPVVLNRLLCDADLVIPVNLLRPESALLYTGPHAGLCPTFSDSETQHQFRGPDAMASGDQKRHLWDKANEIAWLLGVQLTLQVVAGPGESVLRVLAGLDEHVSRQGRALVNATWAYDVSRRAELVVATIEGQLDNQSWENLGRALHAAQQACLPEGTIVLCTELSCEPGPALERLMGGGGDGETLLTPSGSTHWEDSVAAHLLGDARDASHIFLLSQLDEGAVESLGMGHIEKPEQINRICRQYNSCILLANAHRAILRPH